MIPDRRNVRGDALRSYLVLVDADGSTAAEVATRIFGQPTPAAVSRAAGAMRRLSLAGLVRAEHTPVHAIWIPTPAGNAWLAGSSADRPVRDVADSGRARFGGGMMRW
jgi:hypothetical protein